MSVVPLGMKRVFLAFPLETHTKREIAELINGMKPHFENARWVHWENFHITLFFIGEVAPEAINAIKKSVAPVVEKHNSQTILINKLDFFGSPRKPRVLMLTASPKSALPEDLGLLAQDIHSVFNHVTDSTEFLIHITLARFKAQGFRQPFSSLNEKSIEAIKGRELAWGGQAKSVSPKRRTYFYEFEPMELRINRVVLFESVFTPKGVRYEELDRFHFK